MRQEKILFEKALRRTSFFWKFTGIQINYDNSVRKHSYFDYALNHVFYIGNFLILNFGTLSVFYGLLYIFSKQEVLYMIPCVTISLLGDVKSFYFLSNEGKVYDIVNTLRTLQSIDETEGKEEVLNESLRKYFPFMYRGNNILLLIITIGVSAFCAGPLIFIGLHYYSTNEIKLVLQYRILYPFDDTTIKGWAFAYPHQVWSAWVTVFYVYGADHFFYTISAFLHHQFCSLKYDMQRIGPKSFRNYDSTDPQRIEILIYRHKELIRCVEMLNVIYRKSTLFNVVSSSLIICLGGFNVKFIDNTITMIPFAAVLVFGSVQIFLFCYYGDMLMKASIELSDAIYHSSQWYELDAASMKCCLFMLTRSQKPCRITAFGFREINLVTFSRILSTAWSYFTLLNSMYSE